MATIDERLEALTHTVELLASMQKTTEEQVEKTSKQIDKLTRNINRFRHFVLALGADHEARILKLEAEEDDGKEGPQA